ncbi:hypothetical protein ACWDZ8_24265 [Streptomyces sp. NPDC003233]
MLRKVVPPKGALASIAMSFVGVILVVSDGSLSTLLSHPGDFGPDALLLFAALRWVLYTSGATYFPGWSPIKYTAPAVTTILPELACMSVIAGFVGVLGWTSATATSARSTVSSSWTSSRSPRSSPRR